MRILLTILTFLICATTTAQITAYSTLDGSKSTGGELTYYWRQIQGVPARIQHADSMITRVDSLHLGLNEFELTVSNDMGVSKDSVYIYVTMGVLSIPKDTAKRPLKEALKDLQIRVIYQSNQLTFYVLSPKFQEVKFELFDVAGRKLKQGSFKAYQGANTFKEPLYFQRGIYFLRMSNYYDTFTQKIFIR